MAFDSPDKLLLGLLTGIIFGVLLQKGRVAKFDVIVGQLRLNDWTVAKVMATAVAVGSVGVHVLVSMGIAELHIKPALLAGVLVGGVLFGAGLALFGYCPGTGVAASGEGHADAKVGVAGMLAGAVLYVLAYPALKPMMAALGDWGQVTWPQLTGTSPWPWVAALVALIAGGLILLQTLHRTTPGGDGPGGGGVLVGRRTASALGGAGHSDSRRP